MTPIASVSTVLLLMLTPGEHRSLDVGTAPARSPAGPDGEDPAAECWGGIPLDSLVEGFFAREALADVWTATESLLREHFGGDCRYDVGLRTDMDFPGGQFARVGVHVQLDADAAWAKYTAFLHEWTRRVPLADHEKFSFALELP